MYGIPNMKLDKRIVDRRVQLMRDEGITFVTGVEIGRDIPARKLLDEFDAVVLATGATMPRDLRVEGREAAGIHFAMDFLKANTKSLLDSQHTDGAFISAKDKRVVVIGGGDTGTDCVGTAVRHGAASVVQLEIMNRPPDERAPDNPWPQWPKVYKLDYGQEEAKALWGDDPRQYAVSTKRFLTDEAGNVTGLEIVAVDWQVGPDGRVSLQEVPGSERTLGADLVLLALGFLGPEKSLPEQLGCELDARGTILADADKQTTVPGVFTAGDCTRGQSLVVWAINEGRAAARGVDGYLQGEFLEDRSQWGSRTAEVASVG
jgi:glutamate synthase (NADPH/NADH) small chain